MTIAAVEHLGGVQAVDSARSAEAPDPAFFGPLRSAARERLVLQTTSIAGALSAWLTDLAVASG